MKIIRQRVPGSLLVETDRAALRLGNAGQSEMYLSYALTIRGPHGHTDAYILPSVLLDDWGNEIKKLELYRWIRENGQQFPRAEVFGFTPHGVSTQTFLRDLELTAPYPTYAYVDKAAPVTACVLLRAVLLVDPTAGTPEPARVPDDMGEPIRSANVQWWRVNPGQSELSFLDNAPVELR